MMLRFDDLTREERYYSATILPYLFAYNSFSGLHIFEQYLAKNIIPQAIPEASASDIQLVSEVFLERDLPYYKISIPSTAFQNKKVVQSKPDLMILTRSSMYLFECKVFSPGSEYQLHDQLMKQKYVFDIVESVTQHCFENKLHFLVLPHKYDIQDCNVLTWMELFVLFKQIIPGTDYFMHRLSSMVERVAL